ncbi:MAG: hypothetical protein BWY25_00411 [Chloroflexi bacterium ADurb.Bin222]|nr:MAG: hypothetical protein BWY25_00411 [Chloroflexi bacterium ADurb.Bin222]
MTTSVTAGWPLVSVPVLSNTITEMWPARSRASPFLSRTPNSAPRPVPTITAVGVARPMAQGQAMTSTATMLMSARVKALVSAFAGSGGPKKSQPRNVSAAMAMTRGTNTAEIWSASRWMGALLPWASSTRWTICASAVSRPTFVASNLSRPSLFSVAPITGSPGPFSTGSDSPVSMDSSTAERPSMTTPSTGIFSPGRTSTTSPTRTSSTGTSISIPSRNTCAVLGRNPSSFLIASEAPPLARASRSLPRRTRVMMTAEVSR